MITLLGAIIGLLGSLLPKLCGIFQDKLDKKHELDVLDRQVEMTKANINSRLEAIETQATAEEYKALYQTYNSGILWVDALNSTVRPVIAYSFFILYAFTKYPHLRFAFEVINSEHSFVNEMAFITAYQNVMAVLWTEHDEAILAGVISFYYGSRAQEKKN